MSKFFIVRRTNILKDFIIAFLIFISPFLFFIYTLSPEGVHEWNTFFFHIDFSNIGYEVDEILWHLFCNFLIIVILCLWFLTCKHWWRYVILVPILIEVNKVISIYNYVNNYTNDYKVYYKIFICLTLLFLLLILSKKLNYYSLSKSINKQIDEEIYTLMKQVSNYKAKDYKKFKTKLIALRKQKMKIDKKEYLIRLIKLREEFTSNIENK